MLISVIASVYNCEDYVAQMIESIQRQTLQDWEMILIDDASTDSTWDIIEKIEDSRIKRIHNSSNCGLTRNLNECLQIAQGKYIVRMDGDDISYPTRFEEQIKYMEGHTDIVLSGARMQNFGCSNARFSVLTRSDVIKISLIFNAQIPHPTFIFRREFFTAHGLKYNEQLRYAQDYDLEYRAVRLGQISNISETLVGHRIHSKQISTDKRKEQEECANITRRKILYDLGLVLTKREEKIWFNFCDNKTDNINRRFITSIRKIQKKIIIQNRQYKIYDEELLAKIMQQRFEDYTQQEGIHMKKEIISTLIGAGIGASAVKKTEEKKIKASKDLADKHFALFQLMNQWVKVKQKNKSFEDWFIKNGYRSVAIYGMSYVGETLIGELQNTQVEIKYGIDKRADYIFGDVDIVSPDGALEAVDVIVVTTATSFTQIADEMSKKINCPIISIEDILNNLYYFD